MSSTLAIAARRITFVVLLAAALLSLPAMAFAQGSLSRARNAVDDRPRRTPPADDDHDDDDHDHKHKPRRRGGGGGGYGHGHGHDTYHHHLHGDSCDGDDFETFAAKVCGYAIGYAVTSPFWGPHLMVDEGLDVPGHFYHHPYDHGSNGVMAIGDYERPGNNLTRVDVEYAVDFDDLERAGGRVIWETTSRFGIDGSLNYYQEDIGAAGTDSLWIGDANVVYRFAQCENFVMRAGVGVNWMAHSDGGDAGINFTYGADWFPADPLVISAELDAGTLGDATIFHGRATIGVVFDHVEVYTGYDYYEIDDVDLSGFIAGIRIWF